MARVSMNWKVCIASDEALSALRKHLVPLFDTMASTLVVVVPTNKVESVAGAFEAAIVKEDSLGAAFPPLCVANGATEEGMYGHNIFCVVSRCPARLKGSASHALMMQAKDHQRHSLYSKTHGRHRQLV